MFSFGLLLHGNMSTGKAFPTTGIRILVGLFACYNVKALGKFYLNRFVLFIISIILHGCVVPMADNWQ